MAPKFEYIKYQFILLGLSPEVNLKLNFHNTESTIHGIYLKKKLICAFRLHYLFKLIRKCHFEGFYSRFTGGISDINRLLNQAILKSIFYKKGAKNFMVALYLQKLSLLSDGVMWDNFCKYRATMKF